MSAARPFVFNFISPLLSGLLALLLLPLPNGVAQTSETKPSKGAVDLNDLAAEMAESTYLVKKSDKNLSNLIQAYEKLISDSCYPELRKTLAYDPAARSAKCNQLVEKTLQYDPDDPAALCARDGIDARSCREAYQAVQFLALEPGQSPWFGENVQPDSDDIDSRISASTAEESLASIEAQLTQDESSLRANPPERAELEARIESASAQLIGISCKIIRLSLKRKAGMEESEARKNGLPPEFDDPTFQANFNTLSPAEKAQVMEQLSRRPTNPDEQAPRVKAPSPFDEVSGLLSKRPTPAPIAREGQAERTRYVSPACMRFVSRAESVRAALSAATCARWGEFSPHCIEQLRDDRKRALLRKRASSTSKPGEPVLGRNDSGFSKF